MERGEEAGSAEAVGAGGAGVLGRIAAVGLEGLIAEYAGLYGKDHADLSTAAFAAKKNADKNRYRDVGCWDHTRVTLEEPVSTEDGGESDYVHANFVDGGRYPREFIATQAPTAHTLDEFWHMVWERKVGTMVMLCLCKENGRRKCEQYWKLERGASVVLETGYNVTTVARETISIGDHAIVKTTLKVAKGDEKGTRNVLHILHTNWPDKSLPPSTGPLVSLVRKVNCSHRLVAASNGHTAETSPKLVHCSAGVGRTGTLIALDIALALVDKGAPCDILHVVDKLRRQRKQSIQNAHQYVFLYLVVAEYVLARCPHLAPNLNLQPLRDHRNSILPM